MYLPASILITVKDEEDEEEGIGVLATGDDKKFLKRTLQVAKKSKDPETKVLGCV